ncbi:MAG: FKBP-type peptidyl-prolyl cis-trans isomerase [Planctomycetales bacterium]
MNRNVIKCLAGLGLGILAGCSGGSDGAKNSSAIPTAPATEGGAPAASKEAPLPKLPNGAGPMDENPPPTLTATDSGLYYRILREGTGKKPKAFNRVLAHYKGWLDNGKQFDSSYDRGQPISFSLAQVVAGWTEGLQLIGEGGMIELEIPAKLGYKQQRMGDIPPGSTLHFIVELKEVQ